MGVDDVLAGARAGARRLDPHELVAAQGRGALVVDTRTDVQRTEQGDLPGAVVIDRGLPLATDLAGGVEAWLAAGLPMSDGPADVRRSSERPLSGARATPATAR